MKSLYFTLLFICLITSSYAQNISFTDTTNEWYVVNKRAASSAGVSISTFTIYHYYYSGSKNINNKDYQIVVGTSQSVRYSVYNNDTQSINRDSGIIHHYVRKDTASGDIYATISDTSTSEFRLYHNQANIGDTLKTQNIFGAYLFQIVDSIKTVSINNQSYQMYYVMCRSGSYSRYAYIDGLGSLSDPFQLSTASPVHIVSSSYVTCFRNQYGYLQTNDITLNCHDTSINKYLTVQPDNGNRITQTHKVYPQPATTIANIQLPEKLQSGSITVFNPLGQVVHTEAINSKELLEIYNTGNLHGMYYYRITDNTENKVYSGKMLFE